MLQVYDVEKEAYHASTSTSVLRPYFRLNDQCDTDFSYCIQFIPPNCDLYRQTDQGNMMCIPSQASAAMTVCNEKKHKYKMCDGAFEWCNGAAPVMPVLSKIVWLENACITQVIGRECDLRHRCFQQCRWERQSGKCNFFAINSDKFPSSSKRLSTDNCQTFSTLDGTGFSSSSCGPWKVYQMDCVDGLCDDVKAIASTAASTVASTLKADYSTMVIFFRH